ncbi:hypothetical protein B0H10DRAFT_876257 [Mycena sp. CBHHK59/15]|nr:hypothetical protein B0H10DRAFT_876257 [Mycena sp. CBHHK59/15]
MWMLFKATLVQCTSTAPRRANLHSDETPRASRVHEGSAPSLDSGARGLPRADTLSGPFSRGRFALDRVGFTRAPGDSRAQACLRGRLDHRVPATRARLARWGSPERYRGVRARPASGALGLSDSRLDPPNAGDSSRRVPRVPHEPPAPTPVFCAPTPPARGVCNSAAPTRCAIAHGHGTPAVVPVVSRALWALSGAASRAKRGGTYLLAMRAVLVPRVERMRGRLGRKRGSEAVPTSSLGVHLERHKLAGVISL